MKKNYLILSAFFVSVGLLSIQRGRNEHLENYLKEKGHKYPDGIGLGSVSGAPGDASCTACHGGSTQDGASVNTLVIASGVTPVTEYEPSTTYNVALTMTPNPSKRGFQAIALNSSNAMAGSFTAVSGTQVTSSGGKQRVQHTTSGNSGSTPWAWTWTSPSSLSGGDVTFYVASMSSNNNGNNSGDVVYLSQHVIAASSSGIAETPQDKYSFSAGYSVSQHAVIMNFNSLISGDMYFNLVDLNGRSVYTYKMGNAQIGENKEKIVLPSDLKEGIYVVHMFVDNNAMSQKIMIQK